MKIPNKVETARLILQPCEKRDLDPYLRFMKKGETLKRYWKKKEETGKPLQEIDQNKKAKLALAIVQRNGTILIVQAKAQDNVSAWRFPGGMIEPGESESEAASREEYEETGIKCLPVRKLRERVHPTTNLLITYYACDYLSGEPALKEPDKFGQVAWITPEEIREKVTDTIFQPVLDHIQSFE